MSKERLEEIVEKITEQTYDRLIVPKTKIFIDYQDITYLTNTIIEQVERAQEFELEINDWREEVQKWQQFYKESEESHLETKELLHSTINEIKHYREALKFYANRNNYKLEHFDPNLDDYMSTVDYDEGQKARKVLEGE